MSSRAVADQDRRTVPLLHGNRFGRRDAKLYQSRRGIYTAVKPAGGGWAVVDRISARRSSHESRKRDSPVPSLGRALQHVRFPRSLQ